MNSFNQYAFGAVGDWMYPYLARLQPGYRHTSYGRGPEPAAAPANYERDAGAAR